MPPPLGQAARIASRIASAARAAEKAATTVNKGELAAAVSQLRKAKKAKKPVATTDGSLTKATETSSKPTKAPRKASRKKDSTKQEAAPPEEKDISETTRYKSLTSYRNSYTYYTHQDYPLGSTLNNIFAEGRSLGPSGGSRDKYPNNVDVVSDSLCDQIIHYLGHDLDKHEGCDIIDIHPGACLWSQKIHQRLKPRRHLLLEPDERYLDPFIKPLLQQKDSAYRHTTLSGAAPKGYFETYDKIFNGYLLPERDPLPDHDPSLRKPNNTLLVIGSLVRRYSEHRLVTNAVPFPSLILHHMAEAAQSNAMFQRYGLVRLILWIPEDLRAIILPDSILHRSAYSINQESAFDITEVVGGDRSQLARTDTNRKNLHRQRQDQLDLWGARRVLDRMQSKTMSIPEHRRPELHQKALDTDDETLVDYNPIRLPKNKSLEQIVADHEEQLKKFLELAEIPQVKRRYLELPTPRFKLTSTSQEYLKMKDQIPARLFIDVWGVQIALEREYRVTEAEIPEELRESLKSRIVAASNGVTSACHKMFKLDSMRRLTVLLNELYALCKPNPMMEWDRRPYEPMTVADEEFYPRFPMRLLDLKPRPETLADDLMSAGEANHVRRGLLKTLFTHPSAPLIESIERLGPGARELMGPEFTDPLLGGRMDPSLLLTKDITREQLTALTKAYIEWPFRPLGSEALEANEIEVV
ncbi:S-adenosyl-L-methionine-dependent methyltransferase [Aureobasidium sp. EXF-10727]|nr:S-adenosyl-L-methionine-dependent methyltransferase [Aureobasidium sp. EXF-10727]